MFSMISFDPFANNYSLEDEQLDALSKLAEEKGLSTEDIENYIESFSEIFDLQELMDYKNEEKELMNDVFSRKYELTKCPFIWPLWLVDEVYDNLQLKQKKTLKNINVGLIGNEELVNASSWPIVGEIGINAGLPNFFKYLCRAAILEWQLIGKYYPEQVVVITKGIIKASKGIIFTPPPINQREEVLAELLFKDWIKYFPLWYEEIDGVVAEIVNDSMRFIILHEFGHIINKHQVLNNDESHLQEFEADHFATTEMIRFHLESNIHNNFGTKTKISLMLSFILAFSLLEARERILNIDPEGDIYSITHPPTHVRRKHVIKTSIDYLFGNRVASETIFSAFNYSWFYHMSISSLLINNNFPPLSNFYSSELIRHFDSKLNSDQVFGLRSTGISQWPIIAQKIKETEAFKHASTEWVHKNVEIFRSKNSSNVKETDIKKLDAFTGTFTENGMDKLIIKRKKNNLYTDDEMELRYMGSNELLSIGSYVWLEFDESMQRFRMQRNDKYISGIYRRINN